MSDESVTIRVVLAIAMVVLASAVVGALIETGIDTRDTVILILAMLGAGAGLWALDGWWQARRDRNKDK